MEPSNREAIARDILNYAHNLFNGDSPIPTLDKLSPLFERLKREFLPTNSLHQTAKQTLSVLYETTGMPPDKVSLLFASIQPMVPVRISPALPDHPSSIATPPPPLAGAGAGPIISNPQITKWGSVKTKPEGYSSTSGTPAFIEFFHAFQKAMTTLSTPRNSEPTALSILDQLLYQCYINGALEEISKDPHLEFRRLHFLKYALDKIADAYTNLTILGLPKNINALEEEINDRIEAADASENFPESILFQILGNELPPPIMQSTMDELTSFMYLFCEEIKKTSVEEQNVSTYVIELMTFEAISNLHKSLTGLDFKYRNLESYKKIHSFIDPIDTISSLVASLLAVPGMIEKTESSIDQSPVTELRVIETKKGGYSSTQNTPAFIQFFNAFLKTARLRSKAKNPMTDGQSALDNLIYECYIEGALNEIPGDHLELRRLSFLKHALGDMRDFYRLIDVSIPINVRYLIQELTSRIEKAHQPASFPEDILFQIINIQLCPPFKKEIIEKLISFPNEFIKLIKRTNVDETKIALDIAQSITYKAAFILYEQISISPFPYNSLNDYKKIHRLTNSIETIKSLINFILAFPGIVRATPHSLHGASSSGRAPEILAPPVTKPFIPPFPFFSAGLAALHENNLEEALVQTCHIIESYKTLLDLPGGIPESRKCHEALSEFFHLISAQIQRLQRNDSEENEAYDENQLKLESCKAAAKTYFEKFNPTEHITQNLSSFLDELRRIREELTTVAPRPEKRLRS